MKLVYSAYALEQLERILNFLIYELEIGIEKAFQIRNSILDKADAILENIYLGQKEEFLSHLGQSHRRVVINNYKIIYTIKEGYVLVTDIFDSRQDPKRMNG